MDGVRAITHPPTNEPRSSSAKDWPQLNHPYNNSSTQSPKGNTPPLMCLIEGCTRKKFQNEKALKDHMRSKHKEGSSFVSNHMYCAKKSMNLSRNTTAVTTKPKALSVSSWAKVVGIQEGIEEKERKDLEAWEDAKEQRRLDEKFAMVKGLRGWSQKQFTSKPPWNATEFIAASFARDLERALRRKESKKNPNPALLEFLEMTDPEGIEEEFYERLLEFWDFLKYFFTFRIDWPSDGHTCLNSFPDQEDPYSKCIKAYPKNVSLLTPDVKKDLQLRATIHWCIGPMMTFLITNRMSYWYSYKEAINICDVIRYLFGSDEKFAQITGAEITDLKQYNKQ